MDSTEKQFRLQWRRDTEKVSNSVRTDDLIVEDVSLKTRLVQGFTLDPVLHPATLLHPSGSHSAVSNFFQHAERATKNLERIGIKIFFPARDGHVSRSDMIEIRVFGCELVYLASGFVAPGQHISAFKYEKYQSAASQLQTVLEFATGAILVKPNPEQLVEHPWASWY